MAQIVFINAPSFLKQRYDEFAPAGAYAPPLGLACISSALRLEGFEPKIIDPAPFEYDYDTTVELAISHDPDYIGFTAVTAGIYEAAEIANRIKKKNSKIKTIIGGVHLTATPEETMTRFPCFDIGVIGEGEVTSVELFKTLEDGSNLDDVHGLILRENNNLYRTEKREFIKDINTLPMPAWDLLPPLAKNYGLALVWALKQPGLTVVTSRGCVGYCTFCDKSMFGRKYRALSVDNILKMVKDLHYNHGIKDFAFQEDDFVTHKRRLREFCEKLKNEKLNVVWSSTARVNEVNPEILKMMKEAGCWQVYYGIESGCQEILDFFKKNITLDKIQQAAAWTREAGIECAAAVMIGMALESKETIERSIKFFRETHFDLLVLSKFTPLPGSQFYKIAREYGSLIDDWRLMSTKNTVFIPNGLTKEDMDRYHRRLLKKLYLRPIIFWIHFKKLVKNPNTFYQMMLKGYLILAHTLITPVRKFLNIKKKQ